jgi:thiamine-phosphate pyrophosphorylase
MVKCRLLRYFITDRKLCGGLVPLLAIIQRQIAFGIEMIQIREKDLTARELFEFSCAVLHHRGDAPTKILVNSRADIAFAAGADGVHLPANAPRETLPGLLVGRSCHTLAEVDRAKADFVTFGPVFTSPGKGISVGLQSLRQACSSGKPVFALGGVTRENATECEQAGAAGIAAIRMFMEQ